MQSVRWELSRATEAAIKFQPIPSAAWRGWQLMRKQFSSWSCSGEIPEAQSCSLEQPRETSWCSLRSSTSHLHCSLKDRVGPGAGDQKDFFMLPPNQKDANASPGPFKSRSRDRRGVAACLQETNCPGQSLLSFQNCCALPKAGPCCSPLHCFPPAGGVSLHKQELHAGRAGVPVHRHVHPQPRPGRHETHHPGQPPLPAALGRPHR